MEMALDMLSCRQNTQETIRLYECFSVCENIVLIANITSNTQILSITFLCPYHLCLLMYNFICFVSHRIP